MFVKTRENCRLYSTGARIDIGAEPLTRCCAPTGATRVSPRTAVRFAKLFKALGDATRLEILGLLAAGGGSRCACEIEEHFHLGQSTISHHLRVLREAGLVVSERRGLWIHYSLDQRTLADAAGLCATLGFRA